jgi:hypothetical protein
MTIVEVVRRVWRRVDLLVMPVAVPLYIVVVVVVVVDLDDDALEVMEWKYLCLCTLDVRYGGYKQEESDI